MFEKIKKRLVWIVLLVAGAAGLWFFVLREQEIDYTEEVVRTQDVNTYYTFTGHVESNGAQVYTAGSRSKVREWFVDEGDDVTTNDNVLRYDNGTIVKAPMEGTISDLYLDEGDEFAPGTALFRVADYDNPIINFHVDEYDVHALKKGMRVTVRVLSTGEELEARITRVSQEATVSGDLAFYTVRLSLPQNGKLPMGVTCEIIVARESAKNALTVSVGAIQYDRDGKPFVYCYDRYDELVEQRVILGVNDGHVVEIRDGLRSGDTVLIPPSTGFDPMAMREQMMEGMR